MTPTLPGVEIISDGDEVDDRDEAMDEGDNEAKDCIVEAEDCIVVANELVVDDTEDAVGVMVDKLVGNAVEATNHKCHSETDYLVFIISHTHNIAVIIHWNTWTQFRIILTFRIDRQV